MKRQVEYRPRRNGRFQTVEEQLRSPLMTPRVIEGSIGGSHPSRPAPMVRSDDFKKFPEGIVELNSLFSEWSASFSHMWNFDEASGNVLDYGLNDQVTLAPLVANNSPTQNVSTGLVNGDKGVQTTENSTQGFQPVGAGTLDVTTGDVILLGTCRLLTAPAATRQIVGKVNATLTGYYVNALSTGQVRFSVKDSDGTTVHATAAVDHSGASYFDFMAIVSRDFDAQTFNTSLSSGEAVSPPTNTLTNASQFSAASLSGVTTSPSLIFTFLAWGTVPGTLSNNRVGALQRYTKFRGG